MKKKNRTPNKRFKTITLIILILSIACFCITLGLYLYRQMSPQPDDKDITCLDSFNDIVYVYATHDTEVIKYIKNHMDGLGIYCNKSSHSQIQLDNDSRIIFALYSVIDNDNQEERLSLNEIVSSGDPIGANLAVKTYFIKDNYYQVKFLDRYLGRAQVLSCQYENYRFDCFAENYQGVTFNCPKTEAIAKRQLSNICTVNPTNILK